jgi:methyl-accepting chemotaxis protein
MMNLSIHSKSMPLLLMAILVAACGWSLQKGIDVGLSVQLATAGIVVAALAALVSLLLRQRKVIDQVLDLCVRKASEAGINSSGAVGSIDAFTLLISIFTNYEDSIRKLRASNSSLESGIQKLARIVAGDSVSDLPPFLKQISDDIVNLTYRRNDDGPLIQRITKVCEEVAAGDLNSRLLEIPQDHQLTPLMNAINDLVDRSDAFVREAGAAMEYVARNSYYRKIVETGTLGANLKAAKTINSAIEAIKEKMSGFKNVSGSFENKINSVAHALGESALSLKDHAQVMESAATESDAKSASVTTAAQDASNNVQAVSAATVELSASITEISRRVGEQATLTDSAVAEATTASEVIKQLDMTASKIGEVVKLIAGVAEQTNLLALNATIEAARAGDAGRGFAVVASEVRNLASQTATATSDIGKQVGDIQGGTKRSVAAIAAIFSTISNVNNISAAIADSVREQTIATDEIARSIEQVSANTQSVTSEMVHLTEAASRTKAAAAEVLDAANTLTRQSQLVGTEMSTFGNALRRII